MYPEQHNIEQASSKHGSPGHHAHGQHGERRLSATLSSSSLSGLGLAWLGARLAGGVIAAGIVGLTAMSATASPVSAEGPLEQSAAMAADADEGYEIVVVPGAAKKGKQSSTAISIKPKNGWHLNVSFPTSVSVEAPSDVELVKAKLGKGDAAKLEEAGIDFPVAFTAKSAGKKNFSAKLKFAICTEDACKPVTKKLAFSVDVSHARKKSGKKSRAGKKSKS